MVTGQNPPLKSVPKQLTAPSQRETLQHLQRETGYFYTSHDITCLTWKPEVQDCLISIRRVSSWGYLDHLLHQSRGLSNPAAGLFRRVPSRPSSLHLSRLHGSALGTSCTAARQCGRPRCCRGFPPECSGLGVARGKGRKVKAVIISTAAFDITERTLRMEKHLHYPLRSLKEVVGLHHENIWQVIATITSVVINWLAN